MDFNGARVLIVRDAAIGDGIMVTPAIRWYHEHGAKVYVATKPHVGHAVFANNPHVERIVTLLPQESIPARSLEIQRLANANKCTIVRDAAFSCEAKFLFGSNSPGYHWPLEVRQANAEGRSYYEHINRAVLKATDCDCRPELFPTWAEERKFTKMRANRLGSKWVLLQLQGSSLNKCYPFWPQVVEQLHALDRRIIVMTCGDVAGTILEIQILESAKLDRSRIVFNCGTKGWTLRDSLIATKYVDCVVGPETGVINASACFDTPKVPMLSHSSADNLCRGWSACYPVQSPASCSPCYRMVAGEDACNEATPDLWPLPAPRPLLCMASIPPEAIVSRVKEALDAHQG